MRDSSGGSGHGSRARPGLPGDNPVPSAISVSAAHELLGRQRAETDHAFWPADVSILDEHVFKRDRLLGPKQLTDVHLLALAVKHGGCLATIDGGVSLEAVRDAEAGHLVIV